MTQLTPNSRVALTVGSAVGVCGALLYAGWFSANMLRDIKDEVSGLRSDIKAASSDRWTGRDMRDWGTEAERLNTAVTRSEGKLGLILPDARNIQRANRREN